MTINWSRRRENFSAREEFEIQMSIRFTISCSPFTWNVKGGGEAIDEVEVKSSFEQLVMKKQLWGQSK